MKLSLDQQTDYSNRELYNLMKGITLPEFVKDASLNDITNNDNLDKEAFADRYNKAYPINSAVNTYISNAFFSDKKAELRDRWGDKYVNEVESRLDKAATLFKISEELQTFRSQLITKAAADYSAEPIATLKLAGEELPVFEIKTKQDFEKAAKVFAETLTNFSFDARRTVASAFVKKASQYGVDELPDIICKYAGMFYFDKDNLEKQVWYRSRKIASDSQRQSYSDVLKQCIKEADSKEKVFAIAKIAYEKEWEAGLYLNHKTAQLILDPVDAFFNLSIEKVAEMLDVVQIHGDIYQLNDLRKVSSDIYKEAFGLDVYDSGENFLREVLPTMPRSDMSLFCELSGVKPL